MSITMSSMFLFVLSVTATDPGIIAFEEVNLAMEGETPDSLRSPLLRDAFDKLDLNGDGLLDKAERKPLKYKSYLATANFYSEGDHVTRDIFVERAVVPDFGELAGTTRHCVEEDAVVHTTPEALWTHLANGDEDRAWMTVEEFADALHETGEADMSINFEQFTEFATGNTGVPQADADHQFHMVKYSDYTESHNTDCQASAPERRKLFIAVGGGAIAVGFVALLRWVVVSLIYAMLFSVLECLAQQVAHMTAPNGYLNRLYAEGCTFQQYQTDVIYSFALLLFGPYLMEFGSWVLRSTLGFAPSFANTAVQGVRVVTADAGVGEYLAVIDELQAGVQALESDFLPMAEVIGCRTIICL